MKIAGLGRDFKVSGNGTVTIGNNCDIGSEVTFQADGHLISDKEHRVGEGCIFD